MVKINFNALGFFYEDGIRNLRKMFDAAAEGLNRHLQAAYDEVDEFDRAVKGGADPQIERDDDGYVIENHRDILIYHTITAEEAKSTLNKAIALSAFHHWERSAREWTKRPQGSFVTLRSLAEAKHYPISVKLGEVYLLATLLKHANAKHGIELFQKRPDFFRREFDAAHPRIEWFEEITLSDAQISEIFDIIAASGPTSKSIFADYSG